MSMNVPSSLYGVQFSSMHHSRLQPFHGRPSPIDLHTAAPSSGPIRGGAHMLRASGLSDSGSDIEDEEDDIDDSCVLFESTINGDEYMRNDVATRSASDEPDDDDDADIFDSPIPALGRPVSAPFPVISGAPASQFRAMTPPVLQTFGIPELVSDPTRPLSASTSSTLPTPDTNTFQRYLPESTFVGHSPVISAAPHTVYPLHKNLESWRPPTGVTVIQPTANIGHGHGSGGGGGGTGQPHPNLGDYKPPRSSSLPSVGIPTTRAAPPAQAPSVQAAYAVTQQPQRQQMPLQQQQQAPLSSSASHMQPQQHHAPLLQQAQQQQRHLPRQHVRQSQTLPPQPLRQQQQQQRHHHSAPQRQDQQPQPFDEWNNPQSTIWGADGSGIAGTGPSYAIAPAPYLMYEDTTSCGRMTYTSASQPNYGRPETSGATDGGGNEWQSMMMMANRPHAAHINGGDPAGEGLFANGSYRTSR